MAVPKLHIKKKGNRIEVTPRMSTRARIAKVDTDRQLVFGWANVSLHADGRKIIDSQGHTIDPEELENGAYNFVLNFGGMGEDHQGSAKGRLIESMFISPDKLAAMGLKKNALPIGWWIGFHVEDKQAWERVKKGDHRMFSIQGLAQVEYVPDDDEEEEDE